MKQLDPAVTRAITDAVHELERCSSAEVVVEVRGRSGTYAHADARFASLLAFAALLVLLFSPWHFAPIWVALDVVVVWFLGHLIAERSAGIRRMMTSETSRAERVRLFAAAAFHDRGLANTRNETGVLLFHSVLEGRIELLADRGVLEAVPALEWNRILAEARARHAVPAKVVEVLSTLKPLLEKYLPVGDGDQDELCSVPQFVTE